MKKYIFSYALMVAAGALLLQWLQHQYAIRLLSTEAYIVLIAIAFTVLGIWVGHRVTRRPKEQEPGRNQQALDYLQISDAEYRVLEQLAAGYSNQEIADKLYVSPNTVKTHLASLYRKLDVTRRTQAISRARELNLIN